MERGLRDRLPRDKDLDDLLIMVRYITTIMKSKY